MTQYEAWYGIKPQVNYLREFGCTAYAHIANNERKKLDAKARKCNLLGYGGETRGYRLYDIELKRVLHSRDVTFDETVFGIADQVFVKPLFELQLQDESTNEDEQVSDVEQEEPQQDTDKSSQVPTLRQSQGV